MADDQTESTTAKVVGMVAALGAAWAAQKVIALVWKTVTGHTPPDPSKKDDDVNFSEVATAAAITGAVVALSRIVATRGAARLATRVGKGRVTLPR